ncbi:MAG: VanZ family protein [Clostridiales bacterium]|nr:VanZ family protein [Clostridiales bacterium]
MSIIEMYLLDMLHYVGVGLLVYTVARVIYIRVNHRQVNWKRELMLCLFVSYLVGLASQTVFPTWLIANYDGEPYFYFYLRGVGVHLIRSSTEGIRVECSFNGSGPLDNVNLIPLKTILSQLSGQIPVNGDEVVETSILNLLGNVLLFSPIGFFLPALWLKYQTPKRVLWMGLRITVTVEILQYLIGRSTDIDDVILNTLGVMLGFLIYRWLCRLLEKRKIAWSQAFLTPYQE